MKRLLARIAALVCASIAQLEAREGHKKSAAILEAAGKFLAWLEAK
jgi:hypothetical protein